MNNPMNQHHNVPTPASMDGRGDQQEKHVRQGRNDIIFIAALLLIIVILGLGFFLFRKEGSTVTVEVDGDVFGEYSLSRDTVVDIPTGDGELNRLVIRDGEAFMETATCPDGICVGHRPISRKGESIVCLPHRVVITVTDNGVNEGTDEGPDIVV